MTNTNVKFYFGSSFPNKETGAIYFIKGTSGVQGSVYVGDTKIVENAQDVNLTIEGITGSENIAKTYSFLKNGITFGTIDIPKDLIISNGSLRVVDILNQPYSGAEIGNKYIDLELNNGTHINIPVNDLVDVYTGGTGISVGNDNTISLTSEYNTKLNGIETGAQANILEKVQVNGVTLSISDKSVNITATAGGASGSIAINGTDVSVTGLQSAAYVSSSELATSIQGGYADNALQSITGSGAVSVSAKTGAYGGMTQTISLVWEEYYVEPSVVE